MNRGAEIANEDEWRRKMLTALASIEDAIRDAVVDYSWVEQVQTVDAIEKDVIRAMEANPGWKLLHVGMGSGGQTTLTYGWPWRAGGEVDDRD